ncbi:hypothetical protein [Verrucosispora sp. WMMD1129]|nr:hypothetical protein [Verrucosispora sp. WMMD1129]WFE47648.1 hypothetical protein O7624_26645 [Verrucosispora sp. WMMD1129]
MPDQVPASPDDESVECSDRGRSLRTIQGPRRWWRPRWLSWPRTWMS